MKAQLGSFRKGWQSENLARFILYKFSFVAHPSTVADDVGSDFFCTLFQIRRDGGREYLLPRNSFAIQIKSTIDTFDVSNKLEYLDGLEIPFLVGVVDRESLKMTIYSGEYIPAFFSYKGIPEKVEIELCERSLIEQSDYFSEPELGSYALRFPKIMEIGADTEGEELKAKVQGLAELCTLMYENITSKRNGEYIFKYQREGSLYVSIFAGRGSIRVYRQNLLERLAEAFVNLGWLYRANRGLFIEEEFQAYEGLLHRLEALEHIYGPVPSFVKEYYQQVKQLVTNS
jgi:hypothetical protein